MITKVDLPTEEVKRMYETGMLPTRTARDFTFINNDVRLLFDNSIVYDTYRKLNGNNHILLERKLGKESFTLDHPQNLKVWYVTNGECEGLIFAGEKNPTRFDIVMSRKKNFNEKVKNFWMEYKNLILTDRD